MATYSSFLAVKTLKQCTIIDPQNQGAIRTSHMTFYVDENIGSHFCSSLITVGNAILKVIYDLFKSYKRTSLVNAKVDDLSTTRIN